MHFFPRGRCVVGAIASTLEGEQRIRARKGVILTAGGFIYNDEMLAVVCAAAVVRCDRRPDEHYDIGLYFTCLTPEEKRTLSRIIEIQMTAQLTG